MNKNKYEFIATILTYIAGLIILTHLMLDIFGLIHDGKLTDKQKEGIEFCVHHDPSLQTEYNTCIDELVG